MKINTAKKISALLSVCLFMCCLIGTASASSFKIYVTQNGKMVNSEGTSSGDGWSYDYNTNTLTLNNFIGERIYIEISDVNIVLADGSTNIITSEDHLAALEFLFDCNISGEGNGTLICIGKSYLGTYTKGKNSGHAIHGNFTLDDTMAITGGTSDGDSKPLIIKDSEIYTASGEFAEYVVISKKETPAS